MKLIFKIPSVFSYCSLFLSIFIFISSIAIAQKVVKSDSTVSTYLHVKNKDWLASDKLNDPVIGFILNNIDTLEKSNWKSTKITEFEKVKDGYFLKADIPAYVTRNSSNVWCTAITLRSSGNKTDTIRTKYGGVRLSKIKLILNSTPEGAESFLIPNRIWLEKFANTSWDKNDSELEKFRVNTSSTNTYAYVDQTVFVVVFKLNDKYKKVIHYTKPANVQEEQPVWIKF
jgi:hypothetical protein